MAQGLVVSRVKSGSWANEAKIERGDTIARINGHRIRDIIDLRFFGAEAELGIELVKENGSRRHLQAGPEFQKEGGIAFIPLNPRRCPNRCIFCYVDQLPAGLRPSLYIKDEDYRFSFLLGNYVTLSHISKSDIARIKEERLSPLYLSVHCTDEEVRQFMLGGPAPGAGVPVLSLLKELAEAGTVFHTQVVLCPGINDGEYLLKTIYDLAVLHPQVASIAVVPVGLTRYRHGLFPLKPVGKEYAYDILKRLGPVQEALCAKLGSPILHFSDEFYLKAKVPFPDYRDYGDLPQLANGVGLLPHFLKELEQWGHKFRRLAPFPLQGTVVTGALAASFLHPFVQLINTVVGCGLKLVPVRNSFFGSGITVAGLLTGQDLYNSLKGKELGQLLLIPEVMRREDRGAFLDGWTVKELGQALAIRVEAFCPTVLGFMRKLSWLKRSKFVLF